MTNNGSASKSSSPVTIILTGKGIFNASLIVAMALLDTDPGLFEQCRNDKFFESPSSISATNLDLLVLDLLSFPSMTERSGTIPNKSNLAVVASPTVARMRASFV